MPRTMARQAGPIRLRIGPIIQQLRAERRLSLAELGHATGISASHLSRIERGVTGPRFVVLDAIADALETDMAALRTAEEAAQAVDARLAPPLAQLGMPKTAIAELRQLSSATRAKLAAHLTRQSG